MPTSRSMLKWMIFVKCLVSFKIIIFLNREKIKFNPVKDMLAMTGIASYAHSEEGIQDNHIADIPSLDGRNTKTCCQRDKQLPNLEPSIQTMLLFFQYGRKLF